MSSKAGAPKGLRGSEALAKVRVLLTLWDMGAAREEVRKGELTERVTRTNERASDYQKVLDELQNAGAIAIDKNKVSLIAPTGLQILEEGLKNSEFHFDGQQVGTKLANALLNWIRQSNGAVSASVAQQAGVIPSESPTTVKPQAPDVELAQKAPQAITNYEQFKDVALQVYEHLNRDYNLDDLVPIYRIRRQIGDKVARNEFNDWMLKMQAEDIFQLQGGSLPDNDPAKIEDSISTELSGLRCYAKKLIS